MKIAFVDRRATIATTITSVELENAVGVATVRRNARMASVEKTATLARTIGSVILMSVAIRPMTLVSWFVLIASLTQPLQVLSPAVWSSPPLWFLSWLAAAVLAVRVIVPATREQL